MIPYYPGDIIGIDDRYAMVEYLIPWVDCLGIRYLDDGSAGLAPTESVTVVVRAIAPEDCRPDGRVCAARLSDIVLSGVGWGS